MTEKLGEVIEVRSVRPNGTLRIQKDFKNCPSLAEQHMAHLTNINYLIKRYKPDELAAYIAARNSFRPEILGHDFSIEPNLQDAKNTVYKMNKLFDELPSEVKTKFKSPLEFVKFVDNPANAKILVDLGIVAKKKVDDLKDPTVRPNDPPPANPAQPVTTP